MKSKKLENAPVKAQNVQAVPTSGADTGENSEPLKP
jgi:hypothetical protein